MVRSRPRERAWRIAWRISSAASGFSDCKAHLFPLPANQLADALHDIILLGIVGGVLRWDLEDCRDSFIVVLKEVPDLVRDLQKEAKRGGVVVSKKKRIEMCRRETKGKGHAAAAAAYTCTHSRAG